MTALGDGLVIAGACLLAAALVPVRRIVSLLPQGALRRNWYVLSALIAIFIAGYAAYPFLFPRGADGLRGLAVPAIFFLGACFVWLVSTLSLRTTLDVRRIANLERENITDALTGVRNRRYFDRSLESEFAKAARYGLPLSLLILDIDHFKKINDRYGHAVGDRVLQEIGRLLARMVRDADTVSRYGGEEFVVIASLTGSAAAGALAERLRAAVESAVLVLRAEEGGHDDVRATVSIGIATLGAGMRDAQALLRAADAALYRAKDAGRNRVVTSAI